MQVTVLRGIPGGGKSTIAQRLQKERYGKVLIVSADHYHIGEDGVYRFDGSKIKEAHNQCLGVFLNALVAPFSGWDHVVVDNTNIRAYEFAPYYRLAELKDCDVKILTVNCPLKVAIARQTHGVPEDKVAQMYMHLTAEMIPPWWNQESVETG